MGALTEEQRGNLVEFRRQKSKKRLRVVRRQLLLLLTFVGLSASFYARAQGFVPL